MILYIFVHNLKINLMEDREKQLLKEIWNTYSELKEEPDKSFEIRYGKSYKVEPSATSYTTNVSVLLQKIIELQKDYNPSYLDSSTIYNLKLTTGKEVDLIEYAKSKKALQSSMRKATNQIKIDLYSLLKKAEEVSNGIEEPTADKTDKEE